MTPESVWADVQTAAALFAADPAGLGGMAIRGRAGPVRERLLAMLPGASRRLPPNISDEALFGGVDLAATLRAGRPIRAAGLLADLGTGLLVAPMAERLPAPLAAKLAASLDAGAGFGLVMLDESAEPDECAPAALLDRLAFHIDVDALSHRDAPAAAPLPHTAHPLEASVGDDLIEALGNAGAALGIVSVRAILLAVRTTRAAAALAGRTAATTDDAALAARLVLGPRAMRLPPSQPEEPEPQPPENQPETKAEQPGDDTAETLADSAELVLQAARAAIPAGLLARLDQQTGARPGKARRRGGPKTESRAYPAGR